MCSFGPHSNSHHLKVARALLAAGADLRCFFDAACKDEADSETENTGDDDDEDESDFAVYLRQFGLKV